MLIQFYSPLSSSPRYPVIVAALVATLVELWEPFNINDNLTIPVMSGLALHAAFARMQSLCPGTAP